MTALQQRLYEYIEDERFPLLKLYGEFNLARRIRDDAEKKLLAELTGEQKRLFNRFCDAENLLTSIQLQYVFRETLTLVHDILPL